MQVREFEEDAETAGECIFAGAEACYCWQMASNAAVKLAVMDGE